MVALDGGHPLLTPIVALHAFYRVAESTARRRGRDPDQPPHLKKVTETLGAGEISQHAPISFFKEGGAARR